MKRALRRLLRARAKRPLRFPGKPHPLGVSLARFSSALAVAAAVAASVGSAHGASLDWDGDQNPIANNGTTGAGLGVSGTWDNQTTFNWWDPLNPASDLLWDSAASTTAIFWGPSPSAGANYNVALDGANGAIVANILNFKTVGYVLSGDSLTLSSGLVISDAGASDTISSTIHGTSGLTKTGAGSLRLAGTNDFTGPITIEQGAVVVTNNLALGTETALITINGFASRGVQGGQLLVAGDLSSASSLTINRSISFSGRGASTDGAALLSLGNTTFAGNVYAAQLGEDRVGSVYGTANFTGSFNAVSGNSNVILVGNGNFQFSGPVGGESNNAANNVSIDKTGSGALILTNNNNALLGRWQIDAGSIRTSNGAQLGVTARTDAIIPNTGYLEARTDAGNTYSGVNMAFNNSSQALVVDRALTGTGSLGQTITLGNLTAVNALANNNISGRNGTNVTFGTVTYQNAGNDVTLTTAANGLLTLGSITTTGAQTAARNHGVATTGDVLVLGNVTLSGGNFNHILLKSLSGMLTLLGTGTSTGAGAVTTIGNGTVTLGQAGSVVGITLNLGTGTTTGNLNYVGNGGGALYGGSGGGETFAKTINVNSTANNVIFANQTGSAPGALTIPTLTVTAATSSSLYLGGTNALDNTITAGIPAGTALTVGKIGTGTWVLSGNNLYTGITAIYGGTLKIDASAAAGTSTKLADAGPIVFNSDGTAAAVSATAATGGWTNAQTAGGTLIYRGSALAAGTLETVGALTPSGGSGNVIIDSASGAGTALTFASLGTRVANTTLNFIPNSGAIKFNAAVGTAGTIVGGFAVMNGSTSPDFVTALAAGGTVSAPTYGSGNFLALPGSGGTATINYLSDGSTPTTGAIVANSLKIKSGGTVSGTGTLTITSTSATALGGILFDNSGGAGGLSGFTGITTSGSNQELIFYTGGTTAGNTFTVASPLTNGSGSVTKAGTGTMVLSGNNGFTGSLFVNEGVLKASGNIANLLGAPAATSVTSVRQTAMLDMNGAGSGIVPYGTATAIPTVVIGALQGGGANSAAFVGSTTANGAVANLNTITVTSAANLAVGQTVTGPGIGGYPIITAINGTTVTLSSPVTVANGASLAFSNNTTTGATITNSGAASAISLGNSGTTGTTIYTGWIQDGTSGTGGTTVIVNGTAARFQVLTGFNTYTGPTIISGGATLRATNLANGGVASSIGASTNDAANLVFNNGVLQYTGETITNVATFQMTQSPSVNIDRNFTIAGAATIDSSGSYGNNFLGATAANGAALVFSNTAQISYLNTAAAARTLTLTGSSTGDNEIDLQLINNGSTTNSLGVTKASTGLWILGNASNSYTGLTTISGGQLWGQDGTTLPTNSPLVLSGGVLESSGSFTRSVLPSLPTATSASGGVYWNAAGGGFAASNAKLTVNLGNGANLQWGAAGFVPTGQALILGASTALFETEFQNNVDLNGAVRTITINDNATTGADYAILSGNFSSSTGTGGLTIAANAPVVVTGASTYNGTTALTVGELRVTSLGLSTSAVTSSAVGKPSAATTAAILLGNGSTGGATLTYIGAGETSDRAITFNNSGGAAETIDASGSGPLVLTGTFTPQTGATVGVKTLTLNGLNTDFNTIVSNLTDGANGAIGITKNSGGTWVLSGNNNITGPITLNGGILGIGGNLSLGTGTINFGNGQLMAVGTDWTVGNTLNFASGVTSGFVGNYSLTFSSQAVTVNAGAAAPALINNVAAGKSVTFNNGFGLQTATSLTTAIQGSGAWVINGAITQTTNSGLNYTGYAGGSLTFGGTGTNTIGGTFTETSGTIIVNRVGAFNSNSNYSFVGGYLQSTSATPLTGANALIPATLSAPNAGAVGTFNLAGTNLFLTGTGSIEIAGNFVNNNGNRTIYNNLTGGAQLILSGTVALSQDSTDRSLTIGGGAGQINITGQILPSSAATFTNLAGALVKNSTGDLNIALSTPAISASQPYTGIVQVNAGTVTFNNAATAPFTYRRVDVYAGASLNLDNSTSNATGRLGSQAYRSVGLNGGIVNFTANTTAGTSETLGTLSLGSATNLGGAATVSFVNAGTVASSLSFGGLVQNTFTTLNVVAPLLGTTNKVFLPGLLSNGGFGINPRVVVNGSDYATPSANGLVAYNAYLTGNNLDSTGTYSIAPQLDNFNVSSATPAFTGATVTGQSKTVNSLKLSGTNAAVGAGMYTLTVNSGGILGAGTGSTINSGVVAFGGAEGEIYVTSTSDLTISSAITGTAGFTKSGAGSLTLTGPAYTTTNFALNEGTLKLGPSSFASYPTAGTPTVQSLIINGGTFDLNGNNQVLANLLGNNPVSGQNGTITNTGTANANLIVNHASAQTFSGTLTNGASGKLSYYKEGNFVSTFTGASDFSGSTNVYGGTLLLKDSGTFSGSTAVNVNYATLSLDNTGSTDVANRLNTTAPVVLNGGTISLTGAVSLISQQTIGTVNAQRGLSTFNATTTGAGGAFLSMASLARSTGATVNFTGSALGVLFNNTQSGRIIIANQAAGFIGGWATVGGTEFATYNTVIDPNTTPNVAEGVTALVSSTNTAEATWLGTDNVKLVNNATNSYTLAASRAINSLNLQATTTAVTLTNTGNTLTLNSGGLLYNGVDGGSIVGGTLASGGSELFLYTGNNLSVSSQFTGASLNLIMAAPGKTLTLTPAASNTYGASSGATYFNAGTLSVTSGAGIVAIPTSLTVNNAAVTFSQLGQLASGKDLTIIGAGGNVTFPTGQNTLGAVTFNDIGGNTTPQITGGTVSMTSLTSTNDNFASTPTIASIVNLNGSVLSIATSGLSLNNLLISGQILDSTATTASGLSKTGSGSLVLNNATSNFGGGVTLADNGGTLIVDNASTGVVGAVTAGPIGTGALTLGDKTSLMAGSTPRTILNSVTVLGDISLSGPVAGNNILLTGAVGLGSSGRTITVASPLATATLGGTLTGTMPLAKSGLGTLALTGSTLQYAAGINVNAGVLSLDQSLSSFSGPVAVAAGATVNFAPTAAGTLGVAVNPNGVPFAISGAGQVTKTGAFVLNTYGNFTYTGPTTVQAGSLLLTPNAVTNAAPTFSSPVVNLGSQGVVFGLDNAGATAAISVGSGATAVNFLARDAAVSSTRNSDFGSTLNLGGAVTRAAGSSGIFNFVNNIGFQTSPDDSVISTNKIAVGGSTGLIDRGVYVTAGNLGSSTATIARTDFAYRDATGFVRSVAYGADASTSFSAGVTPLAAVSGNYKIAGTVSSTANFVAGAGANTVALFGQNANLNLAAGSNVVNGILRTAVGANPSTQLVNGVPAFADLISTVQGGAIDNGGSELVVRSDSANDWLQINSAITGNGGLTKVGSGVLILGGSTANTFSGTTTLIGTGNVYLNKTGGVTAIGGNVTLGDPSNATLLQYGVANNAHGLDDQIATSAVLTLNASDIVSLNGSSQTLAGLQSLNGTTGIQNNTGTGYYTSTLTINNTLDYNTGAGSVLRDTGTNGAFQYGNLALVKSGIGKLTVGVIDNSGGVKVNAGILALGANSNPGQVAAGTSSTVAGTGFLNVATGATVDLAGFDYTLDYLTGGGTILNTGAATKTVTIGAFDSTNLADETAVNATFSGTISDSVTGAIAVQKRGHGAQTFTAPQNFTAGLILAGGSLTLDLSGLATPTNLIRSNNVLTLGGTLNLIGSATGTTSQAFTSTSLIGGASNISLTPNGGTSTTLALGAITRSANGTIDFPVTSAASIINTTTALANGIFGGYATYNGVNWATSTSSLVGQYSGYTSGLPVSGSTSTVNYLDTTASVTTTAAESINTLKLAPTATQTITLGGLLTLTANGILFDNSSASSTITGSTLGASGSEVIVTVNGSTPANTLTIGSLISAAAGTLTKAGTGTLILTGANAYTGLTRVNEGTVQVATVGAAAAAQPLGAGSLYLGGTNKTATLNYTGATGTYGAAITLGDGGYGTVNTTAATQAVLTLGGVISGAGGLNVTNTGIATTATAGNDLLLSGANTYLGVTNIAPGARLTMTNNAALGASGTLASGTVIQAGGILELSDARTTAEIITVNGSGIGGTGAILYTGVTTDNAAMLKYVILGSNSTISGTGTTIKQIGFANGFVQGNGNTLTLNDTNFIFFTNEVFDNVPIINSNGSLVVEQMTLTGGVNQFLNFTTASKTIQFRAGTVDRTVVFFGGGTNVLQTSSRGGDNFVTQSVTSTFATANTLSLQPAGNATITVNGNILQGGAGVVTLQRTTGGFVALGGTANTSTGGLLTTFPGTIKIAPVSAGAVTNPFTNTAQGVNFTAASFGGAVAFSALPYSSQNFILDNAKAGGAVTQSFGTLNVATGLGPIVQLNNTGVGALALAFSSLTRPVGADLLIGITGANTVPSGNNRIDIASVTAGTVPNGVFWNGSDFVIRDANGGTNQFLRPIAFGTDTGTNLVSGTRATLTNTGTGAGVNANHTKIMGSVTAQTAAVIGTLTMGSGSNLTLAGGTLQLGTTTAGAAVGLLKSGGGSATITGGTALQFGSTVSTEAIIRTDLITDSLSVGPAIAFSGTTGQTLTKFGLGQLILGGASTATFTTNVNEGTVRLATTNALGSLAANTINVNKLGALELTGFITIPNNITIGGSANDSQGFMYQNTGVLRNISGDNAVTGALSGGGFTRVNSDAGTLTISSVTATSTTTYGGTTAVPGTVAGNILLLGVTGAGADVAHDGTGMLTVRPTASLAPTGKSVVSQGGTLVLDYSNMATPTNLFLATEILNARGTSIQLIGKTAAVATAQTFATFTEGDGITRFSATNNGTSVTLNLGAYTLPTGLGTADFLPATGVNYLVASGTAAANNQGTLTAVTGLMGSAANYGWATAGADWASVKGTTPFTIGSYAALGGTYTQFTGTGAAATNFLVDGTNANPTVSGSQALNSLKIATGAAATQTTVNPGGVLNTPAILITGTGDYKFTGGGTVGSATLPTYLQIQGSGTVTLDTPWTDASAASGASLVIAGTGTGGLSITSSGSITMASNAQTNNLYFEGGLPGASRSITNAGSILFNSKGTFDIGHTGTDSVVFTNTGTISVTAGAATTLFNVGNTAGAYGQYVQSGATSSFSSAVGVQFSVNSTAFTSGGQGLVYGAAGSSAFGMQGGTFTVGGTTGAGTYTVFGGTGNFLGTQAGGVVSLNRPGSIALFVAEEGSFGASSSYTLSGGTLSVNGNTIVGARTGAIGSVNVSGGAANFYQGLILGLQDFAQGSFTQTGGTVTVGTGQNISDANYLRGNNTVDLVLGYNQTTNAGAPSTTKGTYNLNGGTLFVDGITTGQGNGYTSSANAAANTFSDGSNVFTTTTGGTAIFNLGGGTLSPYDSELTVGTGINVTLTDVGSTVSSSDKGGIGRLVTFNSPISEAGGSRALAVSGYGVVVFNAANTFTGGLTINGGVARLGNAGALNSTTPNGVTFGPNAAAGTKLQLNSNSVTLPSLDSDAAPGSPAVENGGATNATLTVNKTAGTSTFTGVIQDGTGAGTLAVTKLGGGNFVLGGVNTYTGPTTVSAGTLTVNGSLAAGSPVAVAGPATLTGFGTVNGLTMVASGGTITAAAAGAASLTLSGGLTFTGAGTINLGNVADTADVAILNTGALSALGGAGSVTINVAAGAPYANNVVYKLIGYTGSIDFTAFMKGTIGGLSGRQTASLTNGTNEIDLSVGGDSPVWRGYDSTTGMNSSVWKVDPAVLDFALASNGSPTDFRHTDAIIFDNSVLTANPSGPSSGSRTADISSGDVDPSAVTFNNTTLVTYTITGSNGITGPTGLTFDGNGQVIINNANSFTGGVDVNAGKVTLGDNNALGITNAVSVGSAGAATLQLSNRSITIAGLTGGAQGIVENGGSTTNSVLTVVRAAGTDIFAGTLRNGSGASLLGLVKAGEGTLVLTGTNTYTGGTTITEGTLQIGNNGISGSIKGDVLDNSSLVFNRSDTVTYPGTVSGSGSVTVASGTLVLTGALNNLGLNTVGSGATLQVGDGLSALTNGSVGDIVDSGTVSFDPFTSANYTGTISGNGMVTIDRGTVVLTGALSNTGTTTVAASATLQVGDGTTNGLIGGAITDSGTLSFNAPAATPYLFSGAIVGTGAVHVTNSGSTVILTGGNSYGGGTTIDANTTLQVGNNSTTGSITGDVVDNGSLVFSRSTAASYAGSISGPGAVFVNGAGTVTISPGAIPSSYGGGTFVQRGTLKLGATDVLPTAGTVTLGSIGFAGILDLNAFNQTLAAVATAGTGSSQIVTNNSTVANSTLTFNNAGSTTYGGTIKDGASKKVAVAITGGGSLAYTGAASLNTYTLPTAVQNGTLKIGAANAGAVNSLFTLGTATTNGAVDVNGFTATTGGIGGLTVDPSVPAGSIAAQIVANSSATDGVLGLSPAAPATFAGTIQDTFGTGTQKTGINVLSGTQILTGTNTYTGPTNIASGATLQVGTGGTAGSIASFNGVNNGSFVYNRPTAGLPPSVTFTGTGTILFTNPAIVSTTDGQLNTTNTYIMGNTVAATAVASLDLTNASATLGGLLVRTNSATANTVTIGVGKTLTLGGLTVGSDNPTAATATNLAISGPGNLAISGSLVQIGVAQTVADAGNLDNGIVDLTGLTGAFTANVTTFNVGQGATSAGSLLLANTSNTITATTLDVGDSNAHNGPGITSTLTLGTGTNIIQADTIDVGRSKGSSPGVVKFASQTAGSGGTVTITNKAGSGAANIDIGNLNGTQTAGGAVGTLDLRGHVATVSANTVTLANDNNAGTSTGGTTATLSFDAGTFTANTLSVAPNTASTAANSTATVNIGGGVFTVNTTFTLGSVTGAGSSNATLNLTGGTLTSNANILEGGTGAAVSALNLAGGTLDLTNHSIGSATVSINTVTLQSGTLQNVAQINNGAALSKTTTGTLNLDGTNAFTGQLNVTAGLVSVKSATGLGAPTAGTVVSNNASLELQGSIAVGAEPLSITGTGNASNGALRNLSGTNTYGGPVTVTGATTIQSDAGSLTLSNAAAISGTAQNVTFTGSGDVIVGGAIATTSGSVTKSGAGTLTLNGTNAYTGATNVNAGKLIFGSLDANANALTLANNSTADIAASTMPLTDANTKLLKASSLTLTGNATLDLMNNALAVSYTGASPFAAIDAALTSGFAGGLWNGTGIKSSLAAGDTTYGVPFITALGVVDNSVANFTTFLGRPVVQNSVLVRYTLYGDANLDGVVDGADYTLIDSAYLAIQNMQAQPVNWLNGDFDYSGSIDGADYALIDTAFAFSHPGVGGAPMAQQHEAEFGAVYTDTVASLEAGHGPFNVPEPGSFTLLGAGGLLLGLRRRRASRL